MSNYISNEFLNAATFQRPADETPENLINLGHHRAAKEYLAGSDNQPRYIIDEPAAPAPKPLWQDVKDSFNQPLPSPIANALERARLAIRKSIGLE